MPIYIQTNKQKHGISTNKKHKIGNEMFLANNWPSWAELVCPKTRQISY